MATADAIGVGLGVSNAASFATTELAWQIRTVR